MISYFGVRLCRFSFYSTFQAHVCPSCIDFSSKFSVFRVFVTSDVIPYGYHHYKRNKDVATLQMLFNHSAPSITLKYIGITDDEIDKSLEYFSL